MRSTRHIATLVALWSAIAATAQGPLSGNFARDPKQPIDQSYTDRIHKYTTEPRFLSPLVEYLPASTTVPTPEKVLGDVAGAPDRDQARGRRRTSERRPGERPTFQRFPRSGGGGQSAQNRSISRASESHRRGDTLIS